MPLINQSVPNLIQGVSQQPDAVRFEGQCEDQVNAISSIVDGLSKRQSTEIIANLNHEINENDIVHFIDRSETEQYVITLSNGKLRGYNIARNPPNSNRVCRFTNNLIGSTSSTTELDITSISYLNGLNKNNSKLLTVADNTFIVNKTQAVQPLTDKTPVEDLEALYYIKQGDYDKLYSTDVQLNYARVEVNSNSSVTYNGLGDDITGTTLLNYWSGLSVSTTEADGEEYNRLVGIGANGTLPVGTTINVATSSGTSFNNVNEIAYSFKRKFTDIRVMEEPELSFTLDANGAIDTCTVTKAGAFKVNTITQSIYGGATGLSSILKLVIHKVSDTSSYVLSSTATIRSGEAKPTSVNGQTTSDASIEADTLTIMSDFYNEGLFDDLIEDSTNETHPIHESYKNRYYAQSLTSNLVALRPNKGIMLHTDRNNPDKFKVNVKDGLAGDGLGLVYREVGDITDLPLTCKNGFKVKVGGDIETGADDYYVKFKTSGDGAAGKGTWQETVGFNISKGIDKTTMPYRIINTGVNTFTLDYGSWDEREAGDDDTNPHPSFVSPSATDSRYIENIFFFKNRLGFLSRDNIIMSEAGEAFNFYRKTVSTLLDTAPIDIQVSSPNVVNLKNAVGFQENLIVFSEKGQFVMKGGDILTSKTVSVTPVTNFENDSSINPIALGSYIYFPVKRDKFYGFQEFTVNASTDVYDSNEITEHVPKYIPNNIVEMVGSSTENAIAVVSKGNTGEELSNIYVYRYFFSNNKKLLSSWFKFSVYGTIRGIGFMGSDLNIIIHQPTLQINYVSQTSFNQSYALKLPFSSVSKAQEGTFNHLTNLDFREKLIVNNSQTVDLDFKRFPSTTVCYKDDGSIIPITISNTVTHLSPFSLSKTTITFDDGAQTGTFYIGVPFDFKYTFSELVFKDSKGQGGTPTNSSRYMLKNGTIFFDNTHTFQTKVTPKNRNAQLDTFSANTVGDTITGQLDVSDGGFRFPIFANSDDTTISIIDSTPFSININSAEFEGLVKPRSKRIG